MEEVNLLEQAKALSKLIQNKGKPNEAGTDEADHEKTSTEEEGHGFEQMLKLFKLLNTTGVLEPQEEELTDNTYFITKIKAVIPYLEHTVQRDLGIIIKFMEMQRLMESIKRVTEGGQNPRQEILKVIRPYISEEKQIKLDLLGKVMEINDMLQKMRRQA